MESKLKDLTECIRQISKFIWKITELAFAIAMAGLVAFLLLGGGAGSFPRSVANNFTSLTSSIVVEGHTAILAAVVFVLIARSIKNNK